MSDNVQHSIPVILLPCEYVISYYLSHNRQLSPKCHITFTVNTLSKCSFLYASVLIIWCKQALQLIYIYKGCFKLNTFWDCSGQRSRKQTGPNKWNSRGDRSGLYGEWPNTDAGMKAPWHHHQQTVLLLSPPRPLYHHQEKCPSMFTQQVLLCCTAPPAPMWYSLSMTHCKQRTGECLAFPHTAQMSSCDFHVFGNLKKVMKGCKCLVVLQGSSDSAIWCCLWHTPQTCHHATPILLLHTRKC